jgi:hypothetical protein
MKRGFEEIRERLRTREADLSRRVDEIVAAENSALEQDLEFLTNRQARVEDVASALATHLSSGDDVLGLTSYAEARALAQEASTATVTIRAPKMQIPPEHALQHSEVVNAIHSAITDMTGLLPVIRSSQAAGALKPKKPALVAGLSKKGPSADSALMSAVSQAFGVESDSPQHLSVMSVQTPARRGL